jgi:hypothetical protein
MPLHVLALLLLAAPVAAQEAMPKQAPDSPGASAPVSAPRTQDGLEMAEVLAAADGAFGKGAAGIARAIERAFAENGKPNGYIVGREGGGAFVVGARYGRGTLHSQVEGNRAVFWQGPSVGPDIGGDASTVFILVYDLHDTEDLFQRFPAVDGRAYFVGGIAAGFHRRDGIRLVPVRLGAGWRVGASMGYLHFSKRRRILPL